MVKVTREPEPILEPDLPIIDPHHHLWDLRPLFPHFPLPHHDFIAAIATAPYYTFDQLHADVSTGHRIIGTVFMECGAFYNSDVHTADNTPGTFAPGTFASVGEIEFANGVAAQGASGLYGAYRPCAAIIGHANLGKGDDARAVLEALAAASPRMRGIRHAAAWDGDPDVLGPPFHAPPGLYRDSAFRTGFGHLAQLGLTFDAWLLEPQLDDLISLAKAFPDQPIVLDHCGTPLNIASYRGRLSDRFGIWRENIRALGELPNVCVKLGGLAMAFCGMPDHGPGNGTGSATLAQLWRPYIETCIDAFGAERAMFESNFPVDRWGTDYPTLWNAFKRLASGASVSEKRALFAGTAARVYGIEHLLPGPTANPDTKV